ncbi:MAG: quercetin 2,3-dioxygenase [Actinomycetota bacterium]|nr:quercetin 2,3-dioxygenase [Actinomycetota bacterium]
MTDTLIDVRRAGGRFSTRLGWLDSKHSFSFGRHYSPDNTHFGLLLVSNDDVVAPGTGFETHPHRDMEIVTWVLDGGLVHQDSVGHNGVIYPGLAQRMSAGTGILHSEKNDAWLHAGLAVPPGTAGARPGGGGEDGAGTGGAADTDDRRPVHFVQMWVLPDEGGVDPGYEQLDITDELVQGGLVPVASGMPAHRGESAIKIRQKDAALFAARMRAGESVVLPNAPYVHLYVARGAVTLEGAGRLDTGDAVRVTRADGQRVVADAAHDADSADAVDAEVLVWEMHSTA